MNPMSLSMNAFWTRIEWIAAGSLIWFAQRISTRSATFLGHTIGSITWYIMISRRKVAHHNVASCTGSSQSSRIARASFDSVGRTILEALRLPDKPVHTRWIERDALDPFIRERRPALILGGHLGNWEVAAWSIAQRVDELHLIVAAPKNPYMSDFLDRHRRRWGVVPHLRVAPFRSVLKALAEGHFIGTAADQWPSGQAITIPFLNRPTRFGTSPFRLALKTSTPIVAISAIRSNGAFDIFTECVWDGIEPISIPDELIKRWATFMEQQIRQNPEQYLWMHNRWKEESHLSG